MKRIRRIGVLTGGGDCPGLNAVIRGVVKAVMREHGADVFGFYDGYRGLVLREGKWLGWDDVSGILTMGGTILGTTNRDNPFAFADDHSHPERTRDASADIVAHYRKLRLDALVAIGGDGTLQCAYQLSRLGINVIGVPKTIDNDVRGTELTFGFNTAFTTATDAVDKLHTTAASHHRVMLVEVMGRTAGWLALTAGVAGGGDVVLIPEIPYHLEPICSKLRDRAHRGKHFTIIIVSEGARPANGHAVVRDHVAGSFEPVRLGGISAVLAQQIEDAAGVETRYTILGHLQRGGTTTPFDRLLATQFATGAVELLAHRQFNRMVCLKRGRIGSVPLNVPGKAPRLVSPRSPIIQTARSIGTCFGDET
ncbi:MAG TPA: ATP-dependent 6-phosphofructokinase [Verrucomicrobiae bacterium]|nr:ATP-dependent 6-phosphofructokinase [Verrucomicrobiae bacterium]